MTHGNLQTTDKIYNSLRSSLSGRIAKLTNFTDRSFNYVWTQAFSQEIRELQELSLVTELAGFIDYTGGPVTDDDIEKLGLEGDITAERINELMDDEYLDEYVKIVGVTRDEGAFSSGTVTFSTQAAETEINAPTRVTTAPQGDGSTIDFVTQESVKSSAGTTTVSDVPIQAIERGSDFNVPANTITRISNPSVGVTGVTNTASTSGGRDEETNEELRERAKSAVSGASEGGTVEGIKAYLRNNVDGVQQGNIIIDEFTEEQPPFVDVIVDGGLDTEVTDAIEFSRPAGIRHNLVRPEIVQIGGTIDLLGTDVDVTTVEDTVEQFLLDLGISENFYEDQFVREIMLSDDDIINIDFLDPVIEEVTNETFLYDSGQTDYELQFTFEENNGTISIIDEQGNSYDRPTDYTVEDQTGDGWPETIVWGGGTTPSDGDNFFVDYDVTVPGETKNGDKHDVNLVRDEKKSFNLGQQDGFSYTANVLSYELDYAPFDGSVVVDDASGDVYTLDVDYQLAPLQSYAEEDTFTYDETADDYTLTEDIEIDTVAIIDENGNIYERGVDYTTVDDNTDGFDETIRWDTNNTTPLDGVSFTVNYNGYPKFVRWDQNAATPDEAESFGVTYDQVLYWSDQEIEETPGGIIRDAGGTLYNEDTEYKLVDADNDGEIDAIFWNENPTTLDDDEEFYFTYLNEGDLIFTDRQKADPADFDITVHN